MVMMTIRVNAVESYKLPAEVFVRYTALKGALAGLESKFDELNEDKDFVLSSLYVELDNACERVAQEINRLVSPYTYGRPVVCA